VPLQVAVPDRIAVEVMLEPGAKMSTQSPTFEKELRASDEVEDATVIAEGALAGDFVQASAA
jgi:hypothetical protein